MASQSQNLKEVLLDCEERADSHQKCAVCVILPCQHRLPCQHGPESIQQKIKAILESKGFVEAVPDEVW